MNIRVVFRGMDHSDSMENYVRKALEKTFVLLKGEPDPIAFDVILEAHKQYAHHKVEIRLNSKHNHFIVHSEGVDIYREIDAVVKRLVADIKKQKGKYLDKRNHGVGQEVNGFEHQDLIKEDE